METTLELHQICLDSYKDSGRSIPGHVVDFFYKEGYITDQDYKAYWMDASRMFVPTLCIIESGALAEDIHSKCDRELVIDNKNYLLFQAEQANILFA